MLNHRHGRATKLFLAVLSFILFLSFSYTTYASNFKDICNYKNYLQFVKSGSLTQDIDYETWKNTVKRNSIEENKITKLNNHILLRKPIPDEGFELRKGDVLVTNGTSSSGITGHAGIAISANMILHIAGPGRYPTVINLKGWFQKYHNQYDDYTSVYRHNDYEIASQACDWAYNTYVNSQANYKFNLDLNSTDVTYCSKLVWQAYYFGPNICSAIKPQTNIISPYDLPYFIKGISNCHTYK